MSNLGALMILFMVCSTDKDHLVILAKTLLLLRINLHAAFFQDCFLVKIFMS